MEFSSPGRATFGPCSGADAAAEQPRRRSPEPESASKASLPHWYAQQQQHVRKSPRVIAQQSDRGEEPKQRVAEHAALQESLRPETHAPQAPEGRASPVEADSAGNVQALSGDFAAARQQQPIQREEGLEFYWNHLEEAEENPCEVLTEADLISHLPSTQQLQAVQLHLQHQEQQHQGQQQQEQHYEEQQNHDRQAQHHQDQRHQDQQRQEQQRRKQQHQEQQHQDQEQEEWEQRKSSIQGDCGGGRLRLREASHQTLRRQAHWQCYPEAAQHPVLQHELLREPATTVTPAHEEHQQQQSACKEPELSQPFRGYRQDRRQCAVASDMQRDDSDSLEDVLAAIDEEREPQAPVSVSGGSYLELSAYSDSQQAARSQVLQETGLQRQPPQRTLLELEKQTLQDYHQPPLDMLRPQEQQRRQEEDAGHKKLQIPVEEQLENVSGDSRAREQGQLSVEREACTPCQRLCITQADVQVTRQAAQGDSRGMRQQQNPRLATSQQLIPQQQYEGSSTEVHAARRWQRHPKAARESHESLYDREADVFRANSLQHTGLVRQSAEDGLREERRDHGPQIQQKPEQEVVFPKKQRQDHEKSGNAGMCQGPAKRSRETDAVELEEEVCDFLEADLPPAGVVRWSDYLRLREQQRQQSSRRGELQQQEQQRDWLQVNATQRQQYQTHLSTIPLGSTLPGADSRSGVGGGGQSSEGRFGLVEVRPCIPCHPNVSTESISDAQTISSQSGTTDSRSSSTALPSARSPSRMLTSPRAASTATPVLSGVFSGTGLQPIRPPVGDVRGGSSAAHYVTSNTGREATSSSINKSVPSTSSGGNHGRVAINVSPQPRNNSSGRLQLAGISPRRTDEKNALCRSSTSGTPVRAVNPPHIPFRFSSVERGSIFTPPAHVHSSIAAQRAMTSGLLPAVALPVSPGGVRTGNSAHITEASVSDARPMSSTVETRVPIYTASVLSRGVPASGSARTNSGPPRYAAYEQSHRRGSVSTSEAVAASAARGNTVSAASSLTASSVPRASAVYAAGRGDGDSSSSTRRPVPLEVFFQQRSNRAGAVASRRGSFSSVVVSQTVAASADSPVEHGTVYGGDRTPRPATTTEPPPPRRPSATEAAAASSDPRNASPPVLSASVAAGPTANCDVRRCLSPVAVQDDGGSPRTLPQANAGHSGPQAGGLLACSEDRNTVAASQSTGVTEQASTRGACERPQSHSDNSGGAGESQVEVETGSQAAARQSTQSKVVASMKTRRGSVTTACGSGNMRKFIYLKNHEECIVCLVEIKVKGEVATLEECHHCFCCACLARWIKKSRTCPLCRRPITTVDLWRQVPGALTRDPLAYAFLRRLRPDKNNILRPVAAPKRRPAVHPGRSNRTKAAAPSTRAGAGAASPRRASGREETSEGL